PWRARSCLRPKVGIAPVAVGNDGYLEWQSNAKRRVVPAKAARAFRRVELGYLIRNLGVVLQGDEAMRELFRDVEHLPVFRGQREREVLPEGRRTRAQVGDHIA